MDKERLKCEFLGRIWVEVGELEVIGGFLGRIGVEFRGMV